MKGSIIMSVIVITKENFEEEVLNSPVPVLVDFWAAWCSPCRMLSPVIEEIAEENDGVKVGKVNVDEEPELSARYDIMSIPTVALFRDGDVAEISVGVRPKEAFLAML